MRVATWNLEWATPGTDRHRRAIEHLASVDADVVVTTEHSILDWAAYPYRIDGGDEWGYSMVEGRRKVICWSKQPWTNASTVDTGAMKGRFVAATTSVGNSEVRVFGVCIPWRDAHVRTGRRDRAIWDDHREFCDSLGPLIRAESGALIVAGDFNQRIPRSRQPQRVFDALEAALPELTVDTAGEFEVGKLIDHIASSSGLEAVASTAWSNVIEGKRLTDHSGAAVDYTNVTDTPTSPSPDPLRVVGTPRSQRASSRGTDHSSSVVD